MRLRGIVARLKDRLRDYFLNFEDEYIGFDEDDLIEGDTQPDPGSLFSRLRRLMEPHHVEDQEDSPADEIPRSYVPAARMGLDATLLILTVIASITGLVVIFGLTSSETLYGDAFYYLRRQGLFMVLGFMIMMVISFVDYRVVKKNSMGYICGIGCFSYLGFIYRKRLLHKKTLNNRKRDKHKYRRPSMRCDDYYCCKNDRN